MAGKPVSIKITHKKDIGNIFPVLNFAKKMWNSNKYVNVQISKKYMSYISQAKVKNHNTRDERYWQITLKLMTLLLSIYWFPSWVFVFRKHNIHKSSKNKCHGKILD